MATEPAKSHQPLHNFSLPFLKWGQRSHVNTSNRCRRLLSDTTTPAPRRRTHTEDSSDSDHNKPHPSPNRPSKERESSTIDDENNGVLLVRQNIGKVSDAEATVAADGETKPWNLRPRRSAISNIPNRIVDNGFAVPVAGSMKSGRLLRGGAAATAAEEESEEEKGKKKRKLWISLSKEEIEEDVYSLTGSKPARRPKKRNKTVQKQLDNLFPGLYLVGISADSYRV